MRQAADRSEFSLVNGCGSRSGISTFSSRVTFDRRADFAGIDGRSDGVKRFLDDVRGRETHHLLPAPLSFNAWVNPDAPLRPPPPSVLSNCLRKGGRFWQTLGLIPVVRPLRQFLDGLTSARRSLQYGCQTLPHLSVLAAVSDITTATALTSVRQMMIESSEAAVSEIALIPISVGESSRNRMEGRQPRTSRERWHSRGPADRRKNLH
jgi:hypothetical protein